MFRKLSVLAVAISSVSPLAALAQDFSGAVTLGYSHTDISDADAKMNGLSLDGRLSYSLGNGLSFGTRFDTFRLDAANADLDITGTLMAIDASYAVSDAFSAGVFYEHAEVGASMAGTSISSIAASNTYGIEGSYKTGALEFGGFVATSTPGGLLGASLAGADLDIRHLGLSAAYAPAGNLTIGGSFINTNLDSGAAGVDVDIKYLGLATVYDLNDSYTLFGGLSRTWLKESGVDASLTTIGLGLSYDLGALAGMPLSASVELARTTADLGGSDTDINSIRLGLTIPLGGEGAKAPLNSTADAILNPSHSAISQTVLNF